MTAINGKKQSTVGFLTKNIVQCLKETCLTAYIMRHLQRNLIVREIRLQGLFHAYKTDFLRKLNNTRNIHYISTKFASLRNRNGAFFMLYFRHKELIYMNNISEYIKSNKNLKSLDFLTVYLTIIELIKDGKIELKQNV